MSEIRVRSSSGDYPVVIGPGTFDAELRHGAHAAILADCYFEPLLKSVDVPVVLVEAREENKNLAEVDQLLVALNSAGLTRGGSILAVGGGVVQDLATLAASIYMRGVSWTYVPTTLMAMADSCIGGKSSINVGSIKNLAGNIYPPRSIVIDPQFIPTLRTEDISGGLGEAVKICYCRGEDAFERYLELHANLEVEGMAPLLHHVLESKRWFIEIDEFDRKERRLLNFGHTFAHALEPAVNFTIAHGVAVIVGVVAAAALGERLGRRAPGIERLRDHCQVLLDAIPDLRPRLDALDEEVFSSAFLKDKKHPPDGLRLILPAEAGGVEEVALPKAPEVLSDVRRALDDAISLAT